MGMQTERITHALLVPTLLYRPLWTAPGRPPHATEDCQGGSRF